MRADSGDTIIFQRIEMSSRSRSIEGTSTSGQSRVVEGESMQATDRPYSDGERRPCGRFIVNDFSFKARNRVISKSSSPRPRPQSTRSQWTASRARGTGHGCGPTRHSTRSRPVRPSQKERKTKSIRGCDGRGGRISGRSRPRRVVAFHPKTRDRSREG